MKLYRPSHILFGIIFFVGSYFAYSIYNASAIVLAKFFKAHRCIIYTDVEGVYTTDPNKLKKAKKIKVISYEEMLEMA